MGRTVLRLLAVLLFCSLFLIYSHLWAQVKTEAEIPTFSSNTQLVLVPVLVKSKDGKHIGGLNREAFKVEEQGKARAVATFEELKPVGAERKPRAVLKLEGRSNFNFENAPRGHMTIIVFDMLNTPYLYLGDGRKNLVDHVAKAIPANEATAVFGLGMQGLRQLYAPTANTEALVASLRGVGGPLATVEHEQGVEALDGAEFRTFVDQAALTSGPTARPIGNLRLGSDVQGTSWTTLEAMAQIARAYTLVPGRKTLIWASGGMSGRLSPGVSLSMLREKMENTWRELNAAGIAVYSIDVSGLQEFNGTLEHYRELNQRQVSLREFADSTGGKWCAGVSVDISKCLASAFDDAGSYYMLGYYLPEDDQKPGWRKLKVHVDVPGAHVRAREGFYVSGKADEKADDKRHELLEALVSPVELTGVRMNVREVAATQKAAEGMSRHDFVVGVLGDSIAVNESRGNAVNVSLTAIAFGADGHEHGRIDQLLEASIPQAMMAQFRKTGMSAQRGMDLAPGKYEIHFAVRDNWTGEIGTVKYPLVVR